MQVVLLVDDQDDDVIINFKIKGYCRHAMIKDKDKTKTESIYRF